MQQIYLDHNATSTPWPEVIHAMSEAWQMGYANPGSQHELGRQARRRLEDAREEVATRLGANIAQVRPDRLIFTSGGTEANNLALFGLAGPNAACQPQRAIISALEHPSVTAAADRLAGWGWHIDRLGATSEGLVNPGELDTLLTEAEASQPVAFVSVMLANNETGVCQPIARLAEVCQQHNVPMHTDATQAVGKVPIDFVGLGVAALTFSAHKFQGPQGVGGLLLKSDIELAPQLAGGFQQGGIRPGTEAIPPVVGLLVALQTWHARREPLTQQITSLRDRLEAGLAGGDLEVVINGQAGPRLPQTSNVSFVGLDRQALLMALDLAGVACSTGSACSSGSSEPSSVLRGMGLPESRIKSALRMSLGPQTTTDEVDQAIDRILNCCNRLRTRNGWPKASDSGRGRRPFVVY